MTISDTADSFRDMGTNIIESNHREDLASGRPSRSKGRVESNFDLDSGNLDGGNLDGGLESTDCKDVSPVDVRESLTRVANALQQTGLRELSLVRLKLSDGELSIEGDVASFYLKQVATEAVRPHAKGMQIRNHLRVAAQGPGGPPLSIH